MVSYVKTPYLNGIMGWLSYLGKGWVQGLFCFFLIGISLLLKKDARMAEAGKKGLYSVAFAGLLIQVIKHLIGRPRPKVIDAVGFTFGPSFAAGFDSFPSGHAASAFAFASSLTVFYPGMRYPLYIYALLVSFSRIYVGAHFPSDVFAGIVMGLWVGRTVTTRRWEDIKISMKRYAAPLGIIALSIFLFFYNLGLPGLFDVDEAVYAESAREMMETGDLVTPQYNFTNRYDKPVLFYWLITAAYKIFGVTEFAARFWSALFGVALVLMCYFILHRLGYSRWGAISALILATSLEIIVLSHAAITDMTLTFFITVSIFCFFLGYTEDGSFKRWWYRGFYISAALAVLTKGPVGLIIPVLVIIAFLLLSGRLIETVKGMRIFSGGIIFLIISLPWYITEIWINGWEYIDAFFIKHNFTRYTGVVSGHGEPAYYFIPVILLAFFPWSVFLPYALYKYFPRNMPKGHLQRKESMLLFSLVWFLVIFAFFSLSKTKLPGYIAPLSPAIAIMVGSIWNEYMSATKKSLLPTGLVFSLFSLIIVGLFIAVSISLLPTFLEDSKTMFALFNEPIDWGGSLYLISTAIAGGILFFSLVVWLYQRTFAFGVMVGMVTLLTYFLFTYLMPVADKYLQSTLRDFARVASNRLGQDGTLVVYGLNKPSILFYARRPAIVLGARERESLTEVIESPEKAFIIAKSSQTEGLMDHPNLHIVSERRGYTLSTNKPPDWFKPVVSLSNYSRDEARLRGH